MALSFTACDDDDETPTYELTVQLSYDTLTIEGATVTLTSTQGAIYNKTSNDLGVAEFKVPTGIYAVSANAKLTNTSTNTVLNGTLGEVVVTDSDVNVELTLEAAILSSLVIKELYIGGCMDNDGAKAYQYDPYVIIYNNSGESASLENVCLGMVPPLNAHATNNNYVDGVLSYANEGFHPVNYGIWYFQGAPTIEPYSEVVVAINGAIDHTLTYSNSVNLANAAYYACYDPDDWNNAGRYPAPYEGILTSQYLLAEKWGMGNAWPLSVNDPAFIIFQTEGVTPSEFAAAADFWYDGGNTTQPGVYACLKVKNEWILDAVEVFTTTMDGNTKRLTSTVDAGSVYFTNKHGYSMFRNVDLEATKAIEGNEALLVTGMTSCDDEAADVVKCDKNGIDAVASAKNGAKIIYQDSNNSSNDFFERYQASIKE